MRNRQRWITLLSVLGIGVSGYLTYIHYSGDPILCGGSNSCELVNSSRFAFIGPLPGVGFIPVAALGLGAYITILVLSLIKSDENRLWPAQLIFGFSLMGVLFQAYLSYIELFVLHAICYWCVGSQIIVLLIFILALPRRAPVTE
jgi:uncharacterized membrane protein